MALNTKTAEEKNQFLVLVVDDNRPAAEMMSKLFDMNGYNVECAYNGKQAIEKAARLSPDLILLDIMMPGMNGFDVLQRLREQESTSHIPTIVITAKDTPADVEHGLQLGADDYLPKPIRPRELIARAKSKIESSKLRDALRNRTRDLEALLRASEELSNQLKVDELLNLVLYLTVDLIPCVQTFILHYNERGQELNSRICERDGSITEHHIDVEPIRRQLQTGSMHVRWQESELPLHPDLPCGVAVPLMQNDQLHGILGALSTQPYTDHHVRLLEGIGRQATLALRNAELYQDKVNQADRLEEMVEERTEELRSAQQLLIRSEKLASVGRLAAGIAHEINNPLQPILINMEHMVEDLREGLEIYTEDVEETLKSAQRIRRIVERLLQFTRKGDADKPDMEMLHVASVLGNVLALSHKFLQQAKVEITTDLDEEVYIFGNQDQLEQVFLNIMLNAKDAMQQGGQLNIRSFVMSKELIIEFADTGEGIAPEMIERIFEPFSSTKEEGTGLGLFISYGIVENHNGSIDVKSTQGKGTTFTLRFPIIEESKAD